MTRAPRVTTKVLRGLILIRRAIELDTHSAALTELYSGLDTLKPEVSRALQWISHMDIHKSSMKRWLDA